MTPRALQSWLLRQPVTVARIVRQALAGIDREKALERRRTHTSERFVASVSYLRNGHVETVTAREIVAGVRGRRGT